MSQEQHYQALKNGDPSDVMACDDLYQDLLARSEQCQFEEGKTHCIRHCRGSYLGRLTSRLYLASLHCLCFLLVVALWFQFRCKSAGSQQTDALVNFNTRYPDWIPVSYEIRAEYAAENAPSPFMGRPNEHNTQAWDDLITPTYFSASESDMQKTGESINSSVALADGGYLAALGVYHDIHCLRRLRLFLHSDYYYDELTEANMEYLRDHLGHCIESLRRTIMCNADTNIFTFTWEHAQEVRPGVLRPMPQSNQQRKCVQFDAVENWAMERRVPLRPRLVKPDGDVEKILMI
ncbi:hypothetical protein F5Y18DRAFT_423420 [Xylariaceae sp. FL1019]|nr:hypothetical protein F5Y18DRAFT_423420 [Xylariaceae sp. FL1019]